MASGENNTAITKMGTLDTTAMPTAEATIQRIAQNNVSSTTWRGTTSQYTLTVTEKPLGTTSSINVEDMSMFYIMGGVLSFVGLIIVIIVVCFIYRMMRRTHAVSLRIHSKQNRRSATLSGEHRLSSPFADSHGESLSFHQPLYDVRTDTADEVMLVTEGVNGYSSSAEEYTHCLNRDTTDNELDDNQATCEANPVPVYENQQYNSESYAAPGNEGCGVLKEATAKDDEPTGIGSITCNENGITKTCNSASSVTSKNPMSPRMPGGTKKFTGELKGQMAHKTGSNRSLNKNTADIPLTKHEHEHNRCSYSIFPDSFNELKHSGTNGHNINETVSTISKEEIKRFTEKFESEETDTVYVVDESFPKINPSESKLSKRQHETNKCLESTPCGVLNMTQLPPPCGVLNMTHGYVNVTETSEPVQEGVCSSHVKQNLKYPNGETGQSTDISGDVTPSHNTGRDLLAVAVIKPITKTSINVTKFKGSSNKGRRPEERVAPLPSSSANTDALDHAAVINENDVAAGKRRLHSIPTFTHVATHGQLEHSHVLSNPGCKEDDVHNAKHLTKVDKQAFIRDLSDKIPDGCIQNMHSSTCNQVYVNTEALLKTHLNSIPQDEGSVTQCNNGSADTDQGQTEPDYISPDSYIPKDSDGYIYVDAAEHYSNDSTYIPMDHGIGGVDMYIPMNSHELSSSTDKHCDTKCVVMRRHSSTDRDYISFIDPDKSNTSIYQNIESNACVDYVNVNKYRRGNDDTYIYSDPVVNGAPSTSDCCRTETNTQYVPSVSPVNDNIQSNPTHKKRTVIPVPMKPTIQTKGALSRPSDESKRKHHVRVNGPSQELSSTHIPRLQNKQCVQRHNLARLETEKSGVNEKFASYKTQVTSSTNDRPCLKAGLPPVTSITKRKVSRLPPPRICKI